jgi:hypothetical protein
MRVDRWLGRTLAPDRQPLAALDIGPTHLRWALLDQQDGRWRLQIRQCPVPPDSLEGGRLVDYPAIAEAVSQALAEAGVQRLAMALPADLCHARILQTPAGVRPWRRRAWLQAQASQGPFGTQSAWAAHRLDSPEAGWRVLSTSMDTLHDWQGLAEAAHGQLLVLEDAHQAGWRALDQWCGPAPGACLFQVGHACVQALNEHAGRWQWAWRAHDDADSIERCLAFAASRPAVFVVGEGDLTERIGVALAQAGLNPGTPSPNLDSDGDFTGACWPVLGLAGLRWWP